MSQGWRKRNRIHAVPQDADAEMAAALGQFVNAVCGYRWIPEKFGNECAGLKECDECFPPEPVKKSRGPRFPESDIPHYVYRCFDGTGRLIYVGCTNNPIARVAGHKKRAWWYDQVASTRLTVFPSRRYALGQERKAIGTEMPRWNVKCKWAYRTEAWQPEDYVDFRHAIVQAVETTHGVYGVHTKALLADVDAELNARFGVTAMSGRPA